MKEPTPSSAVYAPPSPRDLANALAIHQAGNLDEAEEQVRAALAQQPDFAPTHVRAGKLHEIRGELSEAEASFRTAHRVQPAFAMPQGRLATLLRGGLPDADRAELETRLEDPELGSEWRAHLLFGLARSATARASMLAPQIVCARPTRGS